MITETQVLADLATDERQRVEFKESFIRPADLAEAMMALAHAEGVPSTWGWRRHRGLRTPVARSTE